MPVEVTARYRGVTEDVQKYARDRGQAIAEEFPKIEHIHIILNMEKHLSIAEVTVQASNHVRVEAEEAGENMRASIDAAMEKASRQLRKHREKVRNYRAAKKHSEAERTGGTEK